MPTVPTAKWKETVCVMKPNTAAQTPSTMQWPQSASVSHTHYTCENDWGPPAKSHHFYQLAACADRCLSCSVASSCDEGKCREGFVWVLNANGETASCKGMLSLLRQPYCISLTIYISCVACSPSCKICTIAGEGKCDSGQCYDGFALDADSQTCKRKEASNEISISSNSLYRQYFCPLQPAVISATAALYQASVTVDSVSKDMLWMWMTPSHAKVSKICMFLFSRLMHAYTQCNFLSLIFRVCWQLPGVWRTWTMQHEQVCWEICLSNCWKGLQMWDHAMPILSFLIWIPELFLE